MSEWKRCLVKDVCDTNISSYSLKENWDFINYLDTGNITENIIQNIQYINLHCEDLPSRAKRKVKDGDIIYSAVRPNQHHYGIIKNSPENFIVSTGFITLRTKEELCDAQYLYYLLTLDDVVNYFQSIAEQSVSTYPSINTSDIENLEIPLPPLETQKKIAAVLSSLDDKIELNTRMNKVLEEIAQVIFKRWFVEFEFPNEKGEPYRSSGGKMKESELGLIPEGWGVKALDEIADFLNGIACQKYPAINEEESFPVIKISEMNAHSLSGSDRVSTSVPDKYLIKNGDVLFSWSGSLIVDLWCYGEGILNQHLFKVTSSNYPKWYYYYWLKHYLKVFQNIAADKVTTMGHIQRKHLHEAKVCVPDDCSMEKMDCVMNGILNKIIVNNIEMTMLSTIRDTLLPKLMSGEIEVPLPV